MSFSFAYLSSKSLFYVIFYLTFASFRILFYLLFFLTLNLVFAISRLVFNTSLACVSNLFVVHLFKADFYCTSPKQKELF